MQKKLVVSFISLFLLSITMTSCFFLFMEDLSPKGPDFTVTFSSETADVNEPVGFSSDFGAIREQGETVYLLLECEDMIYEGEIIKDCSSKGMYAIPAEYNDNYYSVSGNIYFTSSGTKEVVYNWRKYPDEPVSEYNKRIKTVTVQ